MAAVTNTTTMRQTPSPGRIISPKAWGGRRFTIRPNAASNVRFASGWTIWRRWGASEETADIFFGSSYGVPSTLINLGGHPMDNVWLTTAIVVVPLIAGLCLIG